MITCHACGGVLLETYAPCREGEHDQYKPHTQHATDGHCDHCHAAVPVLTLSPGQLAEARRVWAAFASKEERVQTIDS